MELSNGIVNRPRAQDHFMAIHLRFEMDMLSFARCFDIFTPGEHKILKKYRGHNFAPKKLIYNERRAIGKCPLTPEEVGLILRALGFDNSTRIYLVAGDLFGGERFMKPFRSLFPRLKNHSIVDTSRGLAKKTRGITRFSCRLHGKLLHLWESGKPSGFEAAVRRAMLQTSFGEPHKRVTPKSFYTNSWPECFCQTPAKNPADQCPPENTMEILNNQLEDEATNDPSMIGTNSTTLGVGR